MNFAFIGMVFFFLFFPFVSILVPEFFSTSFYVFGLSLIILYEMDLLYERLQGITAYT